MWLKKCNMNVVSAIRERALSWAGHVARMDYKEIGAKALRCRGLPWWRWRQLHWKEVEKDKWSGSHPKRFKFYRWEDMVSTEVSKFTGNTDGFAESLQVSTGWLQLAQDRGHWRQFAKLGKSLVFVWSMWVHNGDSSDASGTKVRPAWCGLVLMGVCGVEWSRVVSKAGPRPQKKVRLREGLRVRGLASTCYLVWMSSWYSAGYGWLVTDEDEWFCLKCRMEPWRPGVIS